EMDEKELSDVFEVVDVPSGSVDRSRLEGEGVEIRDLMVETGFRDSRGDAKRLIRQGGAYLNDERIEDLRYHATSDDLLTPSMLVLRSGKKDYHLVRIVD
ncbi:MAG: S4 domain-containing protein, partial [Bradymonadaceae bacterium]